MAQVGRHSDFGDADEVRLEHGIMHVAALQELAQHMAYLLADTNDIKPGDSLEVFEVEERARTL
jgi:hypothetical protein